MEQKTDASNKAPPGQDQIEANLKRAYNDVLSEPLPDRLTELLNKLKSGDKPDER